MRAFVVSLIAGMLAGIVYGLLQVRSPAPPMVALLGLLGMLVGEQVVPVCRRALNRQPLSMKWFRTECIPKISGTPPAKTGTIPSDTPPS
jgi:XapX domain-containing protein